MDPLGFRSDLMSKHIFVFAGEHSGDLLGSSLIQNLKNEHPNLRISAVAGPKMRAENIDCILPMEKFQVMGFFDIISYLPKLISQFRNIRKWIIKNKPDVCIFIDYAEFSLLMQKSLKKKNLPIKLVQYVSPSVWAWRARRIKPMSKSLDLLLSILPFEKEFFSKTSLPVQYVGNPLITKKESYTYLSNWRQKNNLSEKKPILAIFPGSRTHEIQRNLPLQLQVAKKALEDHPNLQMVLSASSHSDLIEKVSAQHFTKPITIINATSNYNLMKNTDFALATSGTVTLELALHKVPTIVTFAITKKDLFLARRVLRIRMPYFALPNIIFKKELFPEFFGPNFTFDNIYNALNAYLSQKKCSRDVSSNCSKLSAILGTQNASICASEQITILLNSRTCESPSNKSPEFIIQSQ